MVQGGLILLLGMYLNQLVDDYIESSEFHIVTSLHHFNLMDMYLLGIVDIYLCMCIVCVCVCACACVRACVCACVTTGFCFLLLWRTV